VTDLTEDEVMNLGEGLMCEKCQSKLEGAKRSRNNANLFQIRLIFDPEETRIFVCPKKCRI
jgi:hypothetical protein